MADDYVKQEQESALREEKEQELALRREKERASALRRERERERDHEQEQSEERKKAERRMQVDQGREVEAQSASACSSSSTVPCTPHDQASTDSVGKNARFGEGKSCAQEGRDGVMGLAQQLGPDGGSRIGADGAEQGAGGGEERRGSACTGCRGSAQENAPPSGKDGHAARVQQTPRIAEQHPWDHKAGGAHSREGASEGAPKTFPSASSSTGHLQAPAASSSFEPLERESVVNREPASSELGGAPGDERGGGDEAGEVVDDVDGGCAKENEEEYLASAWEAARAKQREREAAREEEAQRARRVAQDQTTSCTAGERERVERDIRELAAQQVGRRQPEERAETAEMEGLIAKERAMLEGLKNDMARSNAGDEARKSAMRERIREEIKELDKAQPQLKELDGCQRTSAGTAMSADGIQGGDDGFGQKCNGGARGDEETDEDDDDEEKSKVAAWLQATKDAGDAAERHSACNQLGARDSGAPRQGPDGKLQGHHGMEKECEKPSKRQSGSDADECEGIVKGEGSQGTIEALQGGGAERARRNKTGVESATKYSIWQMARHGKVSFLHVSHLSPLLPSCLPSPLPPSLNLSLVYVFPSIACAVACADSRKYV